MSAAFGANLLTILIATIASFIFGALYYSALARPWMKASGLTQEEIKSGAAISPYLISFICEFIIAYMLAILLLHISNDGAKDGFSLGTALISAFLIWFGFIATTLIVNHRYAMKGWSLTFIDGFHWLGVVLIQAAVMSLMGL